MSGNKFKKVVLKIHLYLGLASGIVVFVMAITGCLWVFQEEIKNWTENKIEIQPQNTPLLSPSQVREIALQVLPDTHIHGTIYNRDNEPLEVIFYEAEPRFYKSVFLNPYTGEVLKVVDNFEGFFPFLIDGHVNLWMPPKIGSQITAYATKIFVAMLITGIILWWPKSRKSRRQRFRFLWKDTTGWRRKNFDLHGIVGFYVSSLALVLGFSGLIMAFGWVYYVTYKVWGGDQNPRFVIPHHVVEPIRANHQPIDWLIPKLKKEYGDQATFEVHYPPSDSSAVYIEISSEEGVYYNSDYRFFHQQTGEELDPESIYSTYQTSSIADKVIRMNYDIHVGAIGGILGKVIAFFASLVTASLPVTGILLWWGRKNKKNRISSIRNQLVPETIH